MGAHVSPPVLNKAQTFFAACTEQAQGARPHSARPTTLTVIRSRAQRQDMSCSVLSVCVLKDTYRQNKTKQFARNFVDFGPAAR